MGAYINLCVSSLDTGDEANRDIDRLQPIPLPPYKTGYETGIGNRDSDQDTNQTQEESPKIQHRNQTPRVRGPRTIYMSTICKGPGMDPH